MTVGSRRRSTSVTGSRSALARHVGPPGPAQHVPAPRSPAVADDGDASDADTQVLVRPELAPEPQIEPPAEGVPAEPAAEEPAEATAEAAAAPATESLPEPPADLVTSRRVPRVEAEPVALLPRVSALGAVAGAALAVCGVALGISALLWAQPAPPAPREPAGLSAGVQDAGTEGTGATTSPAPAATPAPPAAPAPAPAVQAPAPVLEPVTVLNNSRIDGLAADAAADFEAAGWPVAATGNYRGRLTETTVFHAPGQEAAARDFAARFPGVTRVLPRTPTLPGSGLTVVLTRDFR